MSLRPVPPFAEYDSVPAEWRRAILADVATLSRRNFQPNNGDTLLPYVGLEHISPGNPRLSSWGSSADVQSSKNWFVAGQVLYGKLRPYLDKAVIAEFEGVCSTDILVIDATDAATAAFLVYLLHTPDFVGHAIATTGGVNLPRTNWTSLAEFPFPLPPLPEQRRIAAVLNAIQDAIAAQEDVIAGARAFKRSLMQRLFTYGPGREPAPTKETEIGEIPAHWVVVTIGDVSDISSGTTPSRTNQAYWSGGTVPWVKTGEVDYCCIQATEEYVTPLALQETSLRLYPSGTLLLAMYGQGVTRGKVAVLGIEATINQACAAIRITTSDVQQGYLYHYLVSSYERLRSFSHGTQQLNLNARLIRDYGVPLPPASEQSQISASLSAADAKIAAEEDRKTALAALFKSMLHQLMTGQIRLLTDEGLPVGASGVAGSAPDLPSLPD